MSSSEHKEICLVDDVNVEDVWSRLVEDPAAVLIDVRTQAEWVYVGQPDLSAVGKSVVLIEWQSFPEMQCDPHFVQKLSAELLSSGVEKEAGLYFICRSGIRSSAAAGAMAAAGYGSCHNVVGGFEGPLDDGRHRSRVAGWKAAGLPWVQL